MIMDLNGKVGKLQVLQVLINSKLISGIMEQWIFQRKVIPERNQRMFQVSTNNVTKLIALFKLFSVL